MKPRKYVMEIGLFWDNLVADFSKMEIQFEVKPFRVRNEMADESQFDARALTYSHVLLGKFGVGVQEYKIKKLFEIIEEKHQPLKEGTVKLVRKIRAIEVD